MSNTLTLLVYLFYDSWCLNSNVGHMSTATKAIKVMQFSTTTFRVTGFIWRIVLVFNWSVVAGLSTISIWS